MAMQHRENREGQRFERLIEVMITSSIAQAGPVQDISGYTVFSRGKAGAAHMMAHRMLDESRIELGHQLLSEWIHLQFHMAVFDLALNDWGAAYARFMDEILPAAATTERVRRLGPPLSWRRRGESHP